MIHAEMIAHQFLIQNLCHIHWEKKLGLFLSFILLPYWVLSVTFPSHSPLLFPCNNYQTQPINGLNHTSFPAVVTVLFTAE